MKIILVHDHEEQGSWLPGERHNARNNARCTQTRKTTHSLEVQPQDVDQTPVKKSIRTEDRDKWKR